MANLSNINNKFLFTDGDFLKIGNSAPINNVSSTESGISITNPDVASITLDNTGEGGKTFVIYSDDGGKLNFFDVDANSVRLQIEASGDSIFVGNVGIGVAPSYKLDIEGTSPRIRVKETSSNTSATMVEVENSDGRGAMLGIGGSGRTDILANRGYINAQSETDGLAIGTEGTDPILFYTQGVATSNERMRITSAGNIQFAQDGYINTNTADASDNLSLQLSGGGAFGDTRGACIALAGNENGNGGLIQLRAGQGNYSEVRTYTSGAERTRVEDNGDFILYGGRLYLNSGTGYNNTGYIYLSNGRTAIESNIVNATANGDTSLNFKTRSGGATSSAMYINEFRNVGIGTDSPSRELDIQASSGWAEIALRGNTGGGGSLEFWTNTTKRAEIFADTEDIVFRNTASNVERMRILNNGNISIPNGSIEMKPSGGHGIYLGSNNGSNLLDDYEEGSWTPQVYYQNSTDQANATNTVQEGKYTKIGNLVYVSFRLDFNQSGSPVNDNIGVKNLPFAGANNHYGSNGSAVTTSSIKGLTFQLPVSGSAQAVLADSSNTSNYGNDIGSGNGRFIRGSFTYHAQ